MVVDKRQTSMVMADNNHRALLSNGKNDQLTSLLEKEVNENRIKKKLEYFDEELKYPKGVFFIVSNEFCERFSFYGMRAILSIYLHQRLGYDTDTATTIYHVFLMLCYFFPLFGAIIADSCLGKFKTIFLLSIVYASGNISISLASTPHFYLPMHVFSLLGLFLIAMGTGGIKPCVSAFGGDQFAVPEQEKQLGQFFSIFYFSINSGSLLSTYITPLLRHNIHCFGEDSCYPLAFGVPAFLMVSSLVIFLCGRIFYIVRKPEGNIIVQVSKCIGHALCNKCCKKGGKRDHWLDHADDKYDPVLIEEIKSVLHVMVLFVPLPVFWALFDQQGSRWTFQATNMDGSLGSLGSIQPDQMQIINPFLILVLIPIFELVIYPLFAKCHLIRRPLQRMSTGGILAAVSFVISAVLELCLDHTYAVLPMAGEGQVRIFNSLECPVMLDSSANSLLNANINSLDVLTLQHFPAEKSSAEYAVTFKGSCLGDAPLTGSITVEEEQSLSYFIVKKDATFEIQRIPGQDSVKKSVKQYSKLRILYAVTKSTEIKLTSSGKTMSIMLDAADHSTPAKEMVDMNGNTEVHVGDKQIKDLDLKLGGVYTLVLIEGADGSFSQNLIEVTPHNSIHMLWQFPQYFTITVAEVMFSITGIGFSFTQAPKSMKSVLSATWLLTTSVGNLIVILIAKFIHLKSRSNEFFLFAGLMFFVMCIFMFLSYRYKYVNIEQSASELKPERRGDRVIGVDT